jgi:hypothetical protein
MEPKAGRYRLSLSPFWKPFDRPEISVARRCFREDAVAFNIGVYT